MTVEEKAKAYDDVVNKLRGFMEQGVDPLITRNDVQDFFPELAEFDDERIRKSIIRCLKGNMPDNDYRKENIAWLEKQGEHAKFRDTIQIGDEVTRNEDGVLVNLSQLKRVAKESEQKPASLRRPQWIPSTLQLEALSDAIHHYNSWGYPAIILRGLLDNLKKL